jgi:lysozyme
MIMKLGSRGESLIKSFETLKLKAYMPTPNDVPTIGYGHTKGVKLGQTIDIAEAERLFDLDVKSSVDAVNGLLCPLTQSMFDALVSLVFNVGHSGIKVGSTIGDALRKSPKPDYYVAWSGFALWRKQAGKDLLGLARRRAKEMELFLQDGIPK